MAENRPRGRQRNVTGQGKSIRRRGSGPGIGPVGLSGGYQGRSGGSSRSSNGKRYDSGNTTRSARSGGALMKIILILVVLLGGGGGLGSLLGGGFGDSVSTQGNYTQYEDYGSLWGNLGGGNVSTGWDSGSNTGNLNTSVADGAREKYTEILGNGKDEATIMVYMCGTDMESRSKMATSDLQEMIDADLSEDVNLLVYTGGCNKWQNNAVSSSTNQIWQVKDDGMVCLEKNLDSKSMTDRTHWPFLSAGARRGILRTVIP